MSWRADLRRWTAPARGTGAPAMALLVLALLVIATMPPAPPPSMNGREAVPWTGEVLTVTGVTEISGVETYESVRVESGGRLVIPKGASLSAVSMTMEGDSGLEMTGGTLLLRAGPDGEEASLIANCQYVDLTRGSTVLVWGGNGTGDVDSSAGTRAGVSISAKDYITMSDSSLEVRGGDGLSPEVPLSEFGLMGDHCSGGDAVLALHALGNEGAVNVRSSRVLVQAGRGGDAPDGLPQPGVQGRRGGGYSDGGPVGDRVGTGGSAWFNLSADYIYLDGSNISIGAGAGGDAGDGGQVASGAGYGGGGGGYSGGTGAGATDEVASPGGRVFGDVGSGGNVWMMAECHNLLQNDTRMSLRGGDGGDAGAGGDTRGYGGGGGGGYSGGGGGSDTEPEGAMGGVVSDGVASGGWAMVTWLIEEDARMTGSVLEVRAGDGGDAGDGGMSMSFGGGGGGGLSAGGGSGSHSVPGHSGRSMYGGDGSLVEDRVATGGDARLRINSSTGYLEGDQVSVHAGDGGDGGRGGRSWQDPDNDVWLGGGGGGSYSAGGGGAFSQYSQDPRAGGQAETAKDMVGDGGDGSLRLEIITSTIHAENDISCHRGEKGLCWRSDAVGDTGGQGAGRFTSDGRAHSYVPVGRTMLLGPPSGRESMEMPVFSWLPLHPSTANGRVVDYYMEVSFDVSFESPVHHVTIDNTTFNFTNLEKGLLYWRVTPLYARPHHREGLPSVPFVYTHVNSPPMVDEVPVLNVTVREPKTLDLQPFIHDIDDPIEEIRVFFNSPHVLWAQRFLVTLRYDAYVPPHDIVFNVTDGYDTVRGVLPVRVLDDNHDPVLTGLGDYNPPVHITIEEGRTEELTVRYYDRDGDPVNIRLITPWAGVALVDEDTVEISAKFGDVGKYEVVIIAEDDRGGRSQMTVQVRVGNVGEPPDPPVFLNPPKGSRYDEGDTVLFTIGISDPDLAFGDTVNLTVVSNVSGVLMTTPATGDVTFSVTDLGPGHHLITAIILDGEFQERSNITLVVVGEPEPSKVWSPPEGLWLVLGMLGMAFTLLAVSYIAGYMRKKRRRVR